MKIPKIAQLQRVSSPSLERPASDPLQYLPSQDLHGFGRRVTTKFINSDGNTHQFGR